MIGLIYPLTILACLSAIGTARPTDATAQKHAPDTNSSLVPSEHEFSLDQAQRTVSRDLQQQDQSPSIEIVLYPSLDKVRLPIFVWSGETASSGSLAKITELESCRLVELDRLAHISLDGLETEQCEQQAPRPNQKSNVKREQGHEKGHYESYFRDEHQLPIFGKGATPELRHQQIRGHQEVIWWISPKKLAAFRKGPQHDDIYNNQAILISVDALAEYSERTCARNVILELDPLGYAGERFRVSPERSAAGNLDGLYALLALPLILFSLVVKMVALLLNTLLQTIGCTLYTLLALPFTLFSLVIEIFTSILDVLLLTIGCTCHG